MTQKSFNQADFMEQIAKNLNIRDGVIQRNHKGRQGVLAVVSKLAKEDHRIIMKISSDKNQTFLDIAYTNTNIDKPPSELQVFDKVDISRTTLKYCNKNSDYTYRVRNLEENKGETINNLVRTINELFK